jgi:DNA polymerase III epsilon subunit-like protein
MTFALAPETLAPTPALADTDLVAIDTETTGLWWGERLVEFGAVRFRGDRVIAPTSSATLIAQLKARGFEVAAVDMSEISKTGGGIHCMAQALKRVP